MAQARDFDMGRSKSIRTLEGVPDNKLNGIPKRFVSGVSVTLILRFYPRESRQKRAMGLAGLGDTADIDGCAASADSIEFDTQAT
jgi:hypothetical protein